ncbi:MAG: hypothetical protein DRP74_09395 [Candidatus Omnitrophota bacterium]|nr:MAG: hypothetical protein DRP74_09395 [Candidatus Omnitrophota bacterium]
MSANADSINKARNYAYLLLKFRLRSEKEISDRLKRKKFTPEVIRKTLQFLREKGFINDFEFARSWVNSRVKKPLGILRLKQELKVKGINPDIAEAVLKDLKSNYAEEKIVRELAQEKFKRIKGAEEKKKRRVFNYLLRRGFSPAAIIGSLNQLKCGS